MIWIWKLISMDLDDLDLASQPFLLFITLWYSVRERNLGLEEHGVWECIGNVLFPVCYRIQVSTRLPD